MKICMSVFVFSLQTESTSSSGKCYKSLTLQVLFLVASSWLPLQVPHLLWQWFKPLLNRAAPLGLGRWMLRCSSLNCPPACPGANREGSGLALCWSQGVETQLLVFQTSWKTRAVDFNPGHAANQRNLNGDQLIVMLDCVSPLLVIKLEQPYAECQ